MKTETKIEKLDCGHPESEHSEFTRGYGQDADGKKYCYACCAERDKKQMRDAGKIALYLTEKDGKSEVTNWPGSLRLAVMRETVGRHNMAGKRFDVYFRFEGQSWHGVQFGSNTQICHCNRIK